MAASHTHRASGQEEERRTNLCHGDESMLSAGTPATAADPGGLESSRPQVERVFTPVGPDPTFVSPATCHLVTRMLGLGDRGDHTCAGPERVDPKHFPCKHIR